MSLENTGQRKDIADIVVHDQHLLSRKRGIRLMEFLDHAALRRPELLGGAVQEQRGLVDQPFRRLDILDDDRLRQLLELALFLSRQFFTRIDHDRKVLPAQFLMDFPDQFLA